MTTSVVIGNGKSRQAIDVSNFKTVGPLYGCNAAYRTIPDLDWLVAIDDKIINEILLSSFPRNRFIVPPLDEQYEPASYAPMRRRENAGMCAMREAIKAGHTSIYCVGFDFLFEDAELNMANIYDGTNGYGAETRASVDDCANRMNYLNWFADKNHDIEFIFVYPESEHERPLRTVQAANIYVAYITI